MLILSAFEAQLRGDLVAHAVAGPLQIGVDVPVVPLDVGLGTKGSYLFFAAGESQAEVTLPDAEWWACINGAVDVAFTSDAGVREVLHLNKGSVFAPKPGKAHDIKVVDASAFIRVQIPDSDGVADTTAVGYFDALSNGHVVDWTGGLQSGISARFFGRDAGLNSSATFTSLTNEDENWSAQLNYKHVEWCACFQGTLRVTWKDADSGTSKVAYVTPGMVYSPGVNEDHEISAVNSVVGLVCCFKPGLANLAVTHNLAAGKASSYPLS